MRYLDVNFAVNKLGYELCAMQHFLAFMLHQVVRGLICTILWKRKVHILLLLETIRL